MKEKELVSGLVRELRKIPGAVVFKHADAYTAAIPDISLTWQHRTAWIEVKYLDLRKYSLTDKLRGLQHKVMMDLDRVGTAIYVVYVTDGRRKTVFVAAPVGLHLVDAQAELERRSYRGYDHAWVAAGVRGETRATYETHS